MSKFLAVVAAAFALTAVATPLDLVKRAPPAGFNVTNVSFTGTGCQPSTANTTLYVDNSTFTIIFDRFGASAGPDIPASNNTKDCEISLALQIPTGFNVGIQLWREVGTFSLGTGVNLAGTSSYTFGGASQSLINLQQSGPLDHTDIFEIYNGTPDAVRSPCGTNTNFVVTQTIEIDNSGATSESGLVNIDATDWAFDFTAC